MARMITTRSELQPIPTNWQQVSGYLALAFVLAVACCVLFGVQYTRLADKASQACATTGAAAKLDLSSFVQLCKDVPR